MISRKHLSQNIAFGLFRLLSLSVVGILFAILGFIIYKGIGVIDWEFLTGAPTDGMTSGGIQPAIVGTFCLMTGSALFAFPVGVMSGIYMNEYAPKGWIVRFIRMMTNNLSGIPSIVFGLFGMALFVNYMDFGDSILAGSLTLGLLSLPLVIRTTEEALKAIPDNLREGSRALGATKLQTIWHVILPMGMPNIITGLILALGRVSGETAPILFTCAAYFLPQLPGSIFDQCMALPYHLYVISTSGTDMEAQLPIAYGTALVLILIILLVNLLANALRKYFEKKIKMNKINKIMNGMMNKIETRDVNFWYGDFHALKGISMDIAEKSVVAFIGPSGCGKSTFLRLLNRMNDLIPDTRLTGEILIDGQDIYKKGVQVDELRKNVGMVFQRPNPFPKSIFENVAYGLRVNGVTDNAFIRRRVEETLKGAALWDEVKDKLKVSAYALSGGQQQRLCIARAMAVSPSVLLMDEPASALDPISTAKVEELIHELKKQYTIVIVTHNMQQAARVSDSTAFFYMGEMVEFGDTKKIFTNPDKVETQNYITGRFG